MSRARGTIIPMDDKYAYLAGLSLDDLIAYRDRKLAQIAELDARLARYEVDLAEIQHEKPSRGHNTPTWDLIERSRQRSVDSAQQLLEADEKLLEALLKAIAKCGGGEPEPSQQRRKIIYRR
jgi:hypothetical protein